MKIVRDLSQIRGYKPYADSTLRNMKKEDLIDAIRIIEHNWSVAENFLDTQANNFKILEVQIRKDTAREIFGEIYSNLKYDGHTIGVWKNDLCNIAQKYGIELKDGE